MSAMSLEDHEAGWRELDDMDELTRERVPVRSNVAGMAREEPQESSREISSDRAKDRAKDRVKDRVKDRAMDGDFGMEM